MIHLRSYQHLALRHIQQHVHQGEHRLYISLPTGTGKSVILAALAAQASQQGRVLVLAHLQDLVVQLAGELSRQDLEVGLLMQGHRQLDRPVVVATPASLLSAFDDFIQASSVPVRTLLIDEAHHAIPGSTYAHILSALETAYPEEHIAAIGSTATPFRSDANSMLSLLPTCAFIREIPQMIREHWLAPLTWVPLALDLDLASLPLTHSEDPDYAPEALTRTMLHTAVMQELVRHVVPRLEQRPTLVFAASVEHAQQLAAQFCQAGCRAMAVSGHLRQRQREDIYADWRESRIQVVCNCSLLTEGFDFPMIAALVIARPTRSAGLYVQMLGRGTRPAPGKRDCLVIDVVGNNPDFSHQMVLPHIVGVSTHQELHALTRQPSAPVDPKETLLKRILGAKTQTGLTLLDPIGASPYRWSAYRSSYFAMLNRDTAAIVEPDPSGSGLYHSRLYTMPRGQKPIHVWIEKTDLPLRQQVTLVHETTRSLYHEALGSKDAPWLTAPASEKQRAALKRLYPEEAERMESQTLTKEEASQKITFRKLRWTLTHPPSTKQ
jgi:ATP-dependent helicase IRC3